MILLKNKLSSSKIIATLLVIFAIYILGCGNAFAIGITQSTEAINIITSLDGDKIRFEMHFDGVSDALEIKDDSGIQLDNYDYSNSFESFDYGAAGFSLESTNSNLISHILSDSSTLHTLTFPANSIGDSVTTNASPITIEFYAPARISSLDVTTLDSLKFDVNVTTEAGTIVAAVANRGDFESIYFTESDYFNISPYFLSSGMLSEASGEILAFTNTFNAVNANNTLGDAICDKPYTMIFYTELPATSGNNYGSKLFTGFVRDAMCYSSGTNGPIIDLTTGINTYQLNENDINGYNGYIIIPFDDTIACNITDYSGDDMLPYGIDFEVVNQMNEATNLKSSELNFDAEIFDDKLIVKIKDEVLVDSKIISLSIPAGTLKNTSGYGNQAIDVLSNFILADFSLVHEQFVSGSLQQTIGNINNVVSAMLNDTGVWFNTYIASADFDASYLMDMTAPTEDTDTQITSPYTSEFIPVTSSNTKFTTTLANLAPETDYWWVTSTELSTFNSTYDVREGRIYHFTTLAAPSAMEMQSLDYCTGDTSAVAGDDSVYVTFSQSLTSIGGPSDYTLYIDYNSDGTLDTTIDPSDYSVIQDLQSGMTDNQVRIIFGSEMETALDSVVGARLKVEVNNLSGLVPNLDANGTKYLYVDIPGRSADAVTLTLVEPSASYPIFDFDAGTLDYTVPLLASQYDSMTNNGTLNADLVDTSAQAITSGYINGRFNVTITAEEGHIHKTYTATVTNDDYLINSITIAGETMTPFFPNKYDYDIVLPFGTVDLPTVTGTLDPDIVASTEIVKTVTGDLSTSATVTLETINLELNSAMHSYTLNFTVGAADSTSLTNAEYMTGDTSLLSDDSILISFANDLTNIGSASDYQITFDTNFNGTFDASGDYVMSTSDYSIEQINGYQVKVTLLSGAESHLEGMGELLVKVQAINPNNIEPNIVNQDTAIFDAPSRNVKLGDMSLETPFGEIAADLIDHNDNIVEFYVPSFMYDSITTGGDSTFLGYPDDSALGDSVTFPSVTSESTLTISSSEAYVDKTYSIIIFSADDYLTDITIDGTSLDGFNTFHDTYTITLAEGAQAPSVTGILDSNSSKSVLTTSTSESTSSGTSISYTIKVMDGDAISRTYTVCVTIPKETTPTQFLSAEYDSGNTGLVNGDDTIILTFNNPIVCPGSVSDYVITLDKNSDGTDEVILPESDYNVTLGQNNEIIIKFQGDAESRVETLYNAQYFINIVKPTNLTPAIEDTMVQTATMPGRSILAKSFKLMFGDHTIKIEDFDSASSYFSIPLAKGDLDTAILNGSLTGETLDPAASMEIPSVLNRESQVTVTAAEGHIQKIYGVYLYEDSSFPIAIISNGSTLTNFSPYVSEYNVVLPYGTTTVPSVSLNLPSSEMSDYLSIDTTPSGSLATVYTVTLKVLEENYEHPLHTYVVKYTVDPTAPSSGDSSSSSGSSSSDNDDDKTTSSSTSSSSDIADSISSITSGSLTTATLDTSSSGTTSGTSSSGETTADQVATIINKIQTPAAAKTVLQQLPSTLSQLSQVKETLGSDIDKSSFDNSMSDLVQSTEKLVNLVNQPAQSKALVNNVLKPIGDYYKTVDPKSLASKQLMNNTIKLSNTVIAQAGTVNASWDNVKIETGGRVDLTPSTNQILEAAKNAAQTEAELEKQLADNMDSGLQNAIVSTVTLKMPDSLKDAAKTSAGLNTQTMAALKDNNIEKVNLDLGPVSFGIDEKFIEAQQNTSVSFNVDKGNSLTNDDKEKLPKNTSPVGAPVLNLSASQNQQTNDAFSHPVKVSFSLDYFDYNPKDADELIISRWNEEADTWESVGGAYDPVTNSISVRRIHLSKYTVLKSEKNYSNIEDSWAKNEIAALRGKGIIEDDELFTASDNLTREEFAGWVTKAYGIDTSNLEADFSDLDKDSPYYSAIAAAYEQGIISGKEDGTFDPKGEITKEEMAVMIASAMNKYDYTVDTESFELAQYEEDLPTWAVNSVETVVENGAVDESFFGSAGAVTKEEAAAILYQVYR